MKGIENITEKIQAEAQAQIESLEGDCRASCEEILRKGQDEARQLYWQAMQAETEEAAQRRQRALSAAELERKRALLAEKQQLISESFQLAVDKLCSLPEEEYVQLLARLAAGAAEGEAQLIFSPKDRAMVGKKVVQAANRLLEAQGKPGRLTLAEDSRDIRGGLILQTGRVEVNCSFEALAAYSRAELSVQVAEILFAQ